MASPTCDYLVYYESLAYLIPRLLIWLALSGAAIADAFIHKHIKRRGWQLHVGICVVIASFVVQDVLLLTYSIGSRSGLSAVDDVCKAFIFFSDLADSLFIVSLACLQLNVLQQSFHAYLPMCCCAGAAVSNSCWLLVRVGNQ